MAAGVMIGIDPHKGSHTAFVIDGYEKQLGQLWVRASRPRTRAIIAVSASANSGLITNRPSRSALDAATPQ